MARAGDSVWLHHDRIEINGKMVGGHHGVVDIDDLGYPVQDPYGCCDFSKMLLTCPAEGCTDFSIHPANGGGLCREDTKILQRIFVDLFMDRQEVDEAYAIERISDLIEADGGAERNELLDRPEPTPSDEAPMSEPTLVAPDLSAAIVDEIDRVIAESSMYETDAFSRALLDRLGGLHLALDHRTNALLRIKATLEADAEMRDTGVTAA